MIVSILGKDDFLGMAANAGHDAEAAIKAGQYDEAWKFLHVQKDYFSKHASRCGFSHRDTLCIDGSSGRSFAKILRLEGRHKDALNHILYWIATSRNPTKEHDKQLRSFFNKCDFKSATLEDVEKFLEFCKKDPNFLTIRTQIVEWG